MADNIVLPEYIRRFICAYCLEFTSDKEIPKICTHCKVGFCVECGVKQKQNSKLCFGCGAIPADVRAKMVDASSFASVYMETEWQWRAMADKVFAQKIYQLMKDDELTKYYCSIGIDKHDNPGAWLNTEKYGDPRWTNRERDLTEEEKDILYGKE